MTIPDTAFRYVPDLKGKLIQPEDSRMRLSMADFDTIDNKARELGRPASWRLTHEERNANRKATLAGRMDQDLWVFGYGYLGSWITQRKYRNWVCDQKTILD